MELLDLNLSLTHNEQQLAVEDIHKLMAGGISCSEAIVIVAQKLRDKSKNKPDKSIKTK